MDPEQEVPALRTMELYVSGGFERDQEFVDGRLESRTGFGWTHAHLLATVGAWFWNRREEWQVDALPSYWVKVSATRVRMPDLCVVGWVERASTRHAIHLDVQATFPLLESQQGLAE